MIIIIHIRTFRECLRELVYVVNRTLTPQSTLFDYGVPGSLTQHDMLTLINRFKNLSEILQKDSAVLLGKYKTRFQTCTVSFEKSHDRWNLMRVNLK